MNEKVLVTGMSGLIGTALLNEIGREVESNYALSALNRRVVDGIPTTRADLADFDARYPHFVAQLQTVDPVKYGMDGKAGRAVNFAARKGQDGDQDQDNHGHRADQNISGIFAHGNLRGSSYSGDQAS